MEAMSRGHGRDPRDRNRGAAPRACESPGCPEEGAHPAPKAPDRLREYFWFCKEHAREYNAAWNFCRGLDQAGIDRMIRQDTVWGRPTWPLGMQADARKRKEKPGRSWGDIDVEDMSTLFGEGGPNAFRAEPDTPPPGGSELWALRVLELSRPLTLTALKARYKELAKLLHPDVNGGDVEAEERFKRINLAYATLRSSLSGTGEGARKRAEASSGQ
jgi:hypothetical protein